MPIDHGTEEFGFHAKYNRNPLESFKHKGDHSIKSALDAGPIASTCSSFSWINLLNLTFGLLNLRLSLVLRW